MSQKSFYIAFIRIISSPELEGLGLQTKTDLQTNDTVKSTIQVVPSNTRIKK